MGVVVVVRVEMGLRTSFPPFPLHTCTHTFSLTPYHHHPVPYILPFQMVVPTIPSHHSTIPLDKTDILALLFAFPYPFPTTTCSLPLPGPFPMLLCHFPYFLPYYHTIIVFWFVSTCHCRGQRFPIPATLPTPNHHHHSFPSLLPPFHHLPLLPF